MEYSQSVIEPETYRPVNQQDCTSPILFVFAWLYVAVVATGHTLAGMAFSLFEALLPNYVMFVLAMGKAIGLAIIILPLALFWKNPIYRGVYRAWAAGILFAFLMALVHLAPPYASQLQAILHIILSILFIFLLWVIAQKPVSVRLGEQGRSARSLAWYSAVLIGAIFAYPWLAWGSFGSILDTILQLTTAMIFGLAIAITLELFIFSYLINGEQTAHQSQPGDTDNRRIRASGLRAFFLGGSAIAAVMIIFFSSTGFGYHGMQLLLILGLSVLGFPLAGLNYLIWHGLESRSSGAPAKKGRSWIRERLTPLAFFIGLAAAAPMTLIDPPELHPIINFSPGEILQWGLVSVTVSALIGIILGLVVLLIIYLHHGPIRPAVATGRILEPTRTRLVRPVMLAATVSVISGFVIYFTMGQPGFYGDSLFVILDDQADLSGASEITDPDERREYVYGVLVDHANRTQANLQADLERFNIRYTSYYLVNGLEIPNNPLIRLWLASRPDVDRVLDNPWLRPLPAERPLSLGSAQLPEETIWSLSMIRAPEVWAEFGVTGEGIVVGQSDTGVQWDHPELISSYRGWDAGQEVARHDYNWFDPWFASPIPIDISGHGTHTLGTIVGENTGVAPGATWFGCSNLSRNLGNPAYYLDCMQYMLAPFPINGNPLTDGDPAQGAHVINNSWGCPEIEGCDPTSLLYAVGALRAAGVFVVVSAGNDGPACGSVNAPPAIYEQAFSVGAVNQAGQLASFSSLGPVTVDGSGRIKPDIVAPGLNVLSAYPGDTYHVVSGTSMAGPHLAGVVALMWSANPDLVGDIDRTEQILIETTQPYTGPLPQCPGADEIPSTAIGYGLVDAFQAVQTALEDNRD
jgi:subtilisin family serine protease